MEQKPPPLKKKMASRHSIDPLNCIVIFNQSKKQSLSKFVFQLAKKHGRCFPLQNHFPHLSLHYELALYA